MRMYYAWNQKEWCDGEKSWKLIIKPLKLNLNQKKDFILECPAKVIRNLKQNMKMNPIQ